MMTAILLSTMMFAIVFGAPTQPQSEEDIFVLCDGNPADIFFLLDSSSSIYILDYEKQLQFIQKLVDYFPVSQTETRFGVGVFADRYQQVIDFEDFDNSDDLKLAIGDITKGYGDTQTGRALRKVRKHAFSQARPGVGHVLVVLTDGESRNTAETRREAAILKGQGIHVFAIGIGLSSKTTELEAIGSEPKETYVHNVVNFNVLNKIRKTLAFQVCKAPRHEPYCSAGMNTDVMFAYDATSMGTKNARHVQEFIGDTIQNFANMDDGTIRAGVLSGQCDGDNVNLGVFSDKETMASYVRNNDFRGVDEIVRDLHENSYQKARGGRETARRISVVIVDDNAEKIKNLETEMKKAKSKKDIQFIVIAIGESSEYEILKSLVMKPTESHFFTVPSHSDVDTVKGRFVDTLCEDFKAPSSNGPNKVYYDNFNDIVPRSNLVIESLHLYHTGGTRVQLLIQSSKMISASIVLAMAMVTVAVSAPSSSSHQDTNTLCQGNPADIFFLLDSSTSIWSKHFKTQLKFLQRFVSFFPVSASETQFGVGIFSDYYHQQIELGEFDDVDELKLAIGRIQQRKGGTQTGKALRAVRRNAFRRARPNVSKILVVITDGASTNKAQTLREAAALKSENVQVFAIGIGDKVKMEELVAIGSKPSETYVLTVSSSELLNKIRKTLAYKVCRGKESLHQQYCSAGMETDLMFTYDATSMGTRNSNHVQNLIADTILNFGNMDTGVLRAGLLTRYCDNDDIYLNHYPHLDEMVPVLKNPEFRGLDRMVWQMQNQSFETANGGRETARRIAVVVVDNNVEKLDHLALEMRRAKSKKDIQFVVITIGENPKFESLKRSVLRPVDDHFFNVASHSDLSLIKDTFVSSLCQTLKVPSSPEALVIDENIRNFEDIMPVGHLILNP
ncbi:collagen alpha-4(VI) chain-like [Ylistrum balloti]|uniref:collagen alpha-4(VI) chain-like n=1 Tax=Ylistrum balloti TaxID=509963 RepID=UPI002905ADFB|nr:collagen alpha-4(VI) chain-like [Ylistrum balloti]